MKLVVLAAGKGERLRPITDTRPKPLVKILNKPVICWAIERSINAIKPDDGVVVVVPPGARGEIASLECISSLNGVQVVEQDKPLGTAHALLRALEATGYSDVLLVYSDVYLSKGAEEAIAKLEESSILVGRTDRPWEYGVIRIDGDRVVDVVEKPSKGSEPSDLVFTGVALLAEEHLRLLRSVRISPRGEYELTDLLLEIARSESLGFRVYEGPWRDIGRPWDLLIANRIALDREVEDSRIDGEVHSTAIIEGKVVVEEGAEIGAYTVIEGPAYIAKEAKVGPGSHIRPYTVLLEGSRVGYAVEVKGSIIMEGAKAPHFNYVGDSIVCEGVNLGAGTITANLRFDKRSVKMTVKGMRVDTGLKKLGAVIGAYAQTGINVSIMPGVKIGSHAIVWPGCVVDRDVPSNSVFRCGKA